MDAVVPKEMQPVAGARVSRRRMGFVFTGSRLSHLARHMGRSLAAGERLGPKLPCRPAIARYISVQSCPRRTAFFWIKYSFLYIAIIKCVPLFQFRLNKR